MAPKEYVDYVVSRKSRVVASVAGEAGEAMNSGIRANAILN